MEVRSVHAAVTSLCLLALLTACGGGQGDPQPAVSDSVSPMSARQAAPAVVKSTATPISANLTEGEQLRLTSTITTLVRGTPSLSGADVIALAGSTSIASQKVGHFQVSLTTAPTLAAGTYHGNIAFNLCTRFAKAGGCAAFAKGSPILIPYSLNVSPKSEPGAWSTFQGNEKHTGYVPVVLNPANFSKIWEWSHPTGSRITSVTMEGGKVAVSEDKYFSTQSTFVLAKGDGSVLWSHDFGYVAALNPPAIKDGKVYVATSGHSDTFLFGFDAQTGAQLFRTPFGAQWEHYLAPTVADGAVLTSGGYYGGLYSFSLSGAQQWFVAGPQEDMLTPAVTSTDAFYYSYGKLIDVDRADGSVRFTIADPQFRLCCYMQISAPVIGTNGTNVITFSGDQFSGQASSSTGGYYARQLINFDLNQRLISWRSANSYITQPALGNSMLYAGMLSVARLDAISEQDGAVQWSWTAASGDTRFCRNVVATQNLLFASTDRAAVYAIDLTTHKPVWSYPAPGDLAIDGNTLVISVGCHESAGRLVAIKLK